MSLNQLPKTLALIPDGNRRWARSNKLSVLSGYDKGVKKFISFSEWCMQYGINNIAVWAFSTENFKRQSAETKALFGIYERVVNDREIISSFHKNKTRFKVVGNKTLLPVTLRKSLAKLEKETKNYKERVINMLIGYGGKDDILHAVKNAVKHVSNAASVNEDTIQKYLISSAVPEIDLVIRTSGERRLSGFMPWQTEYSELYFSKKLWPDFTKNDLKGALVDYSKRQRRFGK
jgi:undecaprenyl diphosphate synthase